VTAGEVHIWRIDLDQADAERRRCWALLSPDERERAMRFRFAVHRRRFTVAHGALREILGQYAAADPRDLRFGAGENGKPFLESEPVTFNLSHSAELAVLAVGTDVRIGVDVEHQRADSDHLAIADRFFSPREAAVLRAIDPESRPDAFLECWTRKEAYIKALGAGLSIALDSFDVAFGPGVAPAFLRVDGDPDAPLRWTLHDVDIDPGYRAALMVEGRGHGLLRRAWAPAS